MSTLIHSQLLRSIAAIGLTVLGGCQGIKQSMPDFSVPNILARGKHLSAPIDKPAAPTPKITERNFAQVQIAMGDSLAKEGKIDAALSAYEAALRNDDTLARAYHRLALINEKTGKGRDAKELFLRAMQLDPKNSEIVCDYGYYCYLRQDLREAQKHFELALQLDPNHKRAHNNLGLVYARTGQPAHALSQFAMAGLNSADARANLGFVYLTEKRFPQAKSELQLAASANPGSAKAQNILARFDRIQASAQMEQMPPVASTTLPAAPPSIRGQFDVGPLPAGDETSVVASPPAAAQSAFSVAETPRRAVEPPRLANAETPRPPVAETLRPVTTEAPRPIALASKMAEAPPDEPRSTNCELPTQQLAPVLSDYQF